MNNSRQVRFVDLRNKLNKYGYKNNYGIDSLELVEELFRDVENASQAYKELQGRESRLANDLSVAQAQLFPLRKENARLLKENYQLHLENVQKDNNTSSSKSHQISLESNNQTNNQTDDSNTLQSLQQQLFHAEETIKDLKLALKKRDEELIGFAKSFHETKLLHDDLDQGFYAQTADETVDRIHMTNTANKRIIDQLNSQIDFLNEQLALRENQLVQMDDKTMAYESISQEHQLMKEYCKDLKTSNTSLIEKIKALEKKVLEQDQSSRTVRREINKSKERDSTLHRNPSPSQSTNISQSSLKKRSQKPPHSEPPVLNTMNQHESEDIVETSNSVHVSKLEASNRELETRIDTLEQEKHRLLDTIESMKNQWSAYQSTSQRPSVVTYDDDKHQKILDQQNLIETLQTTINDHSIQIQHLRQVNEELQIRYQDQQTRYEDLRSESESNNSLYLTQIHDLEHKNHEINQKHQLLIDDNNRIQSNLSETIEINQETNKAYETLKNDHEQLILRYKKLQSSYESIKTKQSIIQDKNNSIDQQNQQFHNEIQSLKTLIQSMEIQINNHNQRINHLLKSLDDEINKNQDLQKYSNQLNIENNEIKRNNDILKQTIQSIDEERDQLQSELDDKLMEINHQSEIVTKLQQTNQANQSIIHNLEDRLTQCHNEIATNNRHRETYEGKIYSLTEESNELKQRLNQKSIELTNASNDIQLMTKENQLLTSDLSSTLNECEQLRKRLQELTMFQTQLEQDKRGLEIERDDLLNVYRSTLINNKQLEKDLNEFGSIKQQLNHSIHQLQSELSQSKGIIVGYETSEKKWQTERTSFRHQMDLLNDQYHQSMKKIEALEADNRRIIQDLQTARQTNNMINNRMQTLIKRSQELSESGKVLTSRIVSLERERDSLKHFLSIEQQRLLDMKILVETNRNQAAAKEYELRRLRGEILSGSPLSVKTLPLTPSFSEKQELKAIEKSKTISSIDHIGSIERSRTVLRNENENVISSPGIGNPSSTAHDSELQDSSESGSLSGEINMLLNELQSDFEVVSDKKSSNHDLISSLGLSGVEDDDDQSRE